MDGKGVAGLRPRGVGDVAGLLLEGGGGVAGLRPHGGGGGGPGQAEGDGQSKSDKNFVHLGLLKIKMSWN